MAMLPAAECTSFERTGVGLSRAGAVHVLGVGCPHRAPQHALVETTVFIFDAVLCKEVVDAVSGTEMGVACE